MKVLLADELVDLPSEAGLPCFIYKDNDIFEYSGKVSVCGEPIYRRIFLPSPVYDVQAGKLRRFVLDWIV